MQPTSKGSGTRNSTPPNPGARPLSFEGAIAAKRARWFTLDSTSTLAKNVAFVETHPDALTKLQWTGVKDREAVHSERLNGCCSDPHDVDKMGSLGI